MSSDRIIKSLTESDSPVYVDPKTVRKGYMIIPLRFVDAIGNSQIPTFISNTIYSSWSDIFGEVRKCQTDFVYEGFCIPDNVEANPMIGVNELDKIIDTRKYTIVIQTFQLRLPGQSLVTVYGGFCFPENPARLLCPIKGKLLSISAKPKEAFSVTSQASPSDTEVKTKKWWQFGK